MGSEVILVLSMLVILGVVWTAVGKATAARAAGRDADTALRTDLDAGLAELDQLRTRVLDLEERLDFAERLLAQQRDQTRLTP